MVDATKGTDWSIYPYDPIKPLPIIFAVVLTAIGICQFHQCFRRYRWFQFGRIMIVATSVWVGGFVCRAISVWHQQEVNIYVAQVTLILAAPPLYGAAEFLILSRLLSYLPYHAFIHPGRIVSTFAFLSALIETLIATGAANSAGRGRDLSVQKVGQDLLQAGLVLQCCVEVGFISLVALLEYRCRKAGHFPNHIRSVVYVLYVTSLMLLVRCIIRVLEAFEETQCDLGTWCGVIPTHEAFLWIFEVANITLFVILLAIFHPGKYLPDNSNIFLDPIDGKTERLGPGFSKADRRSIWKTCVDPFNLGAKLMGGGMPVNRFWEEHQPIFDRSVTQVHKAQERGSKV